GVTNGMGLRSETSAWSRELAEAEDHELCRAHDRDPHLGDDLPQVPNLRRIELGVAFHEEGLLWRGAEQCARGPDVGQKGADVTHDLCPQLRSVGLEDHELSPLIDGLFQKKQRSSHVDVFQIRVGITAYGAGAPHEDVAVEHADAVDAAGIESIL